MSESLRMWIETGFNVTYLIVVWGFVIAMALQMERVPKKERPVARLFAWAFALLALGDTGHVGFRVLGFLGEGLDATVNLLGRDVGLVGLGRLTTAITVTLFYVVMLVIWHTRFGKPYGWAGAVVFASAAIRLIVMAFPQNNWNTAESLQSWRIYRNLPLIVMGLTIAYLILRDTREQGDHTFTWIGAMILVSYAFYLPVVFFLPWAPMLGMLMIPKTIAYVAIAWIAYRAYFTEAVSGPLAA